MGHQVRGVIARSKGALCMVAAQAVKVDPAARPEAGGLVGCGIMAGYGAIMNPAKVERGDTVLSGSSPADRCDLTVEAVGHPDVFKQAFHARTTPAPWPRSACPTRGCGSTCACSTST